MIFNELLEFPETLRSIKSVAVLGCGRGHIANTIATLVDMNSKPYKMRVYGIDDTDELMVKYRKNIEFHGHLWLDKFTLPRHVDCVYTDKLQRSYNPYETLAQINMVLKPEGMLCIKIPTALFKYNKLKNTTVSHEPFSYTVPSLIYMLAASGFECVHFKKEKHDNVIYAIVYKKSWPLKRPTWYELVEAGLLTERMNDIVMSTGCLTDEDLILTWITGRNT